MIRVNHACGAALVLTACLLLTGCLASQPAIMTQQWVMEYPTPPAVVTPSGEQGLKMDRLGASVDFITTEMVFRPEPYERGVYPYNRWRVRPADMVGDLLLRDLRASGIFRAVYTAAQPGQARFALEGGVLRFLEVDDKDAWRAELSLSLTLLDTSQKKLPGRVLFQKEYEEAEPIGEKGAKGLTEAMSRAMARISQKALKDIAEAVSKASQP